jgi:beta-1,4-mannosyl-glycoprotein beta-1,4-N-acetylglucosaminyltransferase
VTVDVFMFLDDFDMLDCRLYELDGIVDRFIVIEGDMTFSGIPKPYLLTEAMAAGRYSAYPITVVRAELGDTSMIPFQVRGWMTPESEPNWRREGKQRDAANHLLADLSGDDLVIYGDMDEIPRREIVAGFDGGPMCLWMYYLVYSLRYRHPIAWAGSVIGKRGSIGSSPKSVRHDRQWEYQRIPDAGWHLGWFGEPEDRMQKLAAHTHQELAEETKGGLAVDYPAQMIHVNSGVKLLDYDYDWGLPRWVSDGYAPEIWNKKWDSR